MRKCGTENKLKANDTTTKNNEKNTENFFWDGLGDAM